MNLSSYAELAVRLANAGARAPDESDPLGTPAACASALGDVLTGPVTRRDLDVLRHLRTELTGVFTAAATGDDEAAMRRLNALLLQFPIQPEMVSHDDEQRWHVHLAPQGSVADRAAAGAVIGLALTVSMVGVGRLGICAIASCPRVFIDASPGKSRRYCVEHATRGNVSALRRQQPASLAAQATATAASAAPTPAETAAGRATPAAS